MSEAISHTGNAPWALGQSHFFLFTFMMGDETIDYCHGHKVSSALVKEATVCLSVHHLVRH